MKNRLQLIITIAGLAAALYAVILNLVTAVPAAAQSFVVQSLIFAVVAIVCGIYVLRRSGGWRGGLFTTAGERQPGGGQQRPKYLRALRKSPLRQLHNS